MNDEDFLLTGRQAFTEESAELLEKAEAILLRLEDEPDSRDLINELFRAVHTIKGSAGIFGFDDVVGFTHVAESVLGQLREGALLLDEALLGLLLDSRDQIELLVGQVIDHPGKLLAEDRRRQGDRLLAGLQAYLDNGGGIDNDAAAGAAARLRVGNDHWHISLRFERKLFVNGMDPLSFFRYLATVGDIVNLTTLSTDMPSLAQMNPEDCYLGFEIELASEASREDIVDVFEFVMDDCQLQVLPPRSRIADYQALIDFLPEENMALGEILVASGALTREERDAALQFQAEQTIIQSIDGDDGGSTEEVVSKPQFGDVLVDRGMTDSRLVDAAVDKQTRIKEARQVEQQTLRIKAEKLAGLINLVGELVICSAHTQLRARATGQDALLESAEQLSGLVEAIRDATLALRMVPVGETFSRFKRVVRDVSKELNKKVELKISGAGTELDKTVVEQISDPLMHLIRNGLDHGIERPEVRLANGKPEVATLTLEAYHDSGSIVIEISDDGKGLDPELILGMAIDKGIVSASQQLSIAEIQRLIFAPGFSTASEVTSISGRGVGMDVVNRNIDALRGQIIVDSEVGIGTRFIIRLPLTLAIIDGFQVVVGNSAYVIPLDLVEECIELDPALVESSQGSFVELRGEIMPYLHLAEVFGPGGGCRPALQRNNIVVVQHAGRKTGLVVDELLGEHQTVIKPLGKIFENLKGISGATILGSGEVAMIIDVPALVERVANAASCGPKGDGPNVH